MTLNLLDQTKAIKRRQSVEGGIICAETSLEKATTIIFPGAVTSLTTIQLSCLGLSESFDPCSLTLSRRHGGLGSGLEARGPRE